MKNAWLYALGFALLGGVAFGSSPAKAATSTGPYYAPPAQDQKLQCDTEATCPRFIVLSNFTGEEPGPGGTTILTTVAVLDRETGLVWEQSPSTSPFDWEGAQLHCNQLSKGNRYGWRLPTIQELASLMDPSQSNPVLPSGHPFSNVQLQMSKYWSATTYANSSAWGMLFAGGEVHSAVKSSNDGFAWCMRGGQGVDPQ